MARISISVSTVLLAALLPFASLVSSAPQPRTDTFDYVVVGGGAAGSVIASRLSEDSSKTVLLLEAGPDHGDLLTGRVPYTYGQLFVGQYSWNYTFVPTPGLNNRNGVPYFRGHMLGGSSSMNGMTYTRGPSSDWDRIASHTGDDSWSWDNMQTYFHRNEAFQPPANEPPNNRYTPSVHGTSGAISVSLNLNNPWIVPPTIEAAESIGLPYNDDINSGAPIGVGWQQFAIGNGERSSARTGYLGAAVRARPNLHVRTGARAERLEEHGGRLRFRNVWYRDVGTGDLVEVRANREIIVSAGVVGTPVLLLKSGLGPAAELREARIRPALNIPAVGKNFIEHPGLPLSWQVNSTLTDDTLDRDPAAFAAEMELWQTSKTGRLAQTSLTHLIYGRVPADHPAWEGLTVDPAGGEVGPHYELIVANKWTTQAPRPATGNFVSMTTFVMASNSAGSVRLNANDPLNGMPRIHANTLDTNWDREAMKYTVRQALAYMKTPAWARFNATPAFDAEIETDDAKLEAFIANTAFGGAHGVGTAKMGPANSPAGSDVVGPDFKVKGVDGIRVVDASVLPFIPTAHAMVPVYALAEKAADVIKASA